MSRMTTTCATAVLALALAPATAGARTYDVHAELGPQIAKVAKKTSVPVRIPASIDLDFDGKVFASGFGSKKEWSLGLDGARPCGANVCFLASFSGERGGTPAFKRTVKLANGITGYYKPLSCGGSCSPPYLQWKQGGFLYSIQAKVDRAGADPQRRAMVSAANSAIRSRPY
jgi:hypothetical protein